MICVAFLNLHFGFVIFWHKNIGLKAHKMLMKLSISSTLIIQTDFYKQHRANSKSWA
jgi:hypothetical protein